MSLLIAPFFGNRLLVSLPFQDLFLNLDLRRASQVRDFLGRTALPSRPKTLVKPVQFPATQGSLVQAHYKEYTFPQPSWRFWLRPSKALCEYRSYGVFERLGIRCAERIACGEERDGLGRLRHAFVLTRTIACTLPLPAFLEQVCPGRDTAESRALRDRLCLEIAEMVRRLHRAHFFHNDLHWRNILIESNPESSYKVWWIDCPRGRFDWTPLSRRRRRKDLAELAAGSLALCTNCERLKFFKQYLGIRKLGARHKRLARAILRLSQKYWPEPARAAFEDAAKQC